MEQQEKLQALFNTPRMGHVWDGRLPLDPGNSVEGLYEMVNRYFKQDFVVVEVGSFQGTSTMLFSMFCKTVYSVDCYDYPVPPSGRIPSHDQTFVDAENIFLSRMNDMPNVIKVKKHSVDAALDFKDGSLDAVYIDAEHDYQNVLADVRAWKSKVKSGGIFCGHDWSLPFLSQILSNEQLINELNTYKDDSWSVVIR
jgi:hypothetical protein